MVKRVILFLFCFIGLSLVYAQTKVDAIIKGSIHQSKNNYIEFFYRNNPLDDSLQQLKINLDDKGKFSVNLPIQRPLDLLVKFNNQVVNMYIEPQENVSFFVYENSGQQINFSSDFKHNNYLLEYYKWFSSEKIKKLRTQHLLNDSPDEYLKFEDSLLNAKLNFLATFTSQNLLSKTFLRRVKASYVYGAANAKFNYPAQYKFLTNKNVNISSTYYDFMNNLSVRENDLLTVPEFFDYLSNYYTYRYNTENVNLNSEEELIAFEYKFADELFEDNVRAIFLTKKFGELLDSHPYELTKSYISSYMSEIRSNEYREYIDRKIEEATKGASDTKAYNFTLLDQNGKHVNLSDFAGKNIYLNFWASWCLPCLAEINNHNEIQRTYNDKNFITIMVSINEDINAWKKALKEYDKNIIQLQVSGMENEVVKKYNVKSIPRSFMINKDGIIIHSSVPSPTNINVHKYLLFD